MMQNLVLQEGDVVKVCGQTIAFVTPQLLQHV